MTPTEPDRTDLAAWIEGQAQHGTAPHELVRVALELAKRVIELEKKLRELQDEGSE